MLSKFKKTRGRDFPGSPFLQPLIAYYRKPQVPGTQFAGTRYPITFYKPKCMASRTTEHFRALGVISLLFLLILLSQRYSSRAAPQPPVKNRMMNYKL
jgi:hypothetical protein